MYEGEYASGVVCLMLNHLYTFIIDSTMGSILLAPKKLLSWYLHLAFPSSTPQNCSAAVLESSSTSHAWFLLSLLYIPSLRLTKLTREHTAKYGLFCTLSSKTAMPPNTL